ncbi:MAG: hypothetical protein IKQ91_09255, partial [Oscillospiraceae bacterium]|nr:hypothetical protein [Oscillospiraceae bacterium]
MKHFLRTTAAALAAAFLLGGAGSLTAAAADNKEPETVKVESVCQDFVPLSDDIIRILPTEDCTLTAKIVQHSPERENLVLYDSTLELKQGVYYVFAAEPGSYTAYFSMEAIENSKVLCKYET